MASYLRPRRGKKATAVSQNIILKRGEIFFEVPDGGVGTGIGKIKMGDGTTAYNALPYFLQQPETVEVSTSAVTFTAASSTATNATLLNTIKSGATVQTIIGAIKTLLANLDNSVTELNNDLGNVTVNLVFIGTSAPANGTGYLIFINSSTHVMYYRANDTSSWVNVASVWT